MFDLNSEAQARLSQQRVEALRAEADIRRLLKQAQKGPRPSLLARLTGKRKAPAEAVLAQR